MQKQLVDKNALLDELKKVENSAMFAARIIQATDKYTAESIMFASLSVVRDVINNAPAIDDPVRHGHWIFRCIVGEDPYECSVCGNSVDVLGFDYCPNCGAIMDEPEV